MLTSSLVEYVIARGDDDTFRDMRDAFSAEIKADRKSTGNARFEIWVEPDPGESRKSERLDDDDEDIIF